MARRWRGLALVAISAVLAGTFGTTEAGEREARHSGFKLVRTLKGAAGWGPNFSPDGKLLASVSADVDGMICLFDVATGKLLRQTDLGGATLFEAVFVQGGRTLVTCGQKHPKKYQRNRFYVHLLDVDFPTNGERSEKSVNSS